MVFLRLVWLLATKGDNVSFATLIYPCSVPLLYLALPFSFFNHSVTVLNTTPTLLTFLWDSPTDSEEGRAAFLSLKTKSTRLCPLFSIAE